MRDSRSRLGTRALIGLALASLVAGVALPARADDDDHRGRREREVRHDRDDHRDWRGRDAYASAPFYAPPPVVYTPPPAPAGLSLFFNFR